LVKCISCGSAASKPFFSEKGYTYVRCRGCGLVYINKPIKQEFEKSAPFDKSRIKEWSGSRISLYKKDMKSIMKLKPSGRVLDIGCGSGVFLEMAKQEGYAIKGIDPDPYMARFSREEKKLDVFQGTLKNFKRSAKFDIITLWDVLEHVPAPDEELKLVHNHLKKDGILVLRVPASGYVALKKFFIKLLSLKLKKNLDPPTHIFFFSEKSLRNLLRENNFEIIRIKTSRSEIPPNWRSRALKGLLYHLAKCINLLTLGRINFVIDFTVYARKCQK